MGKREQGEKNKDWETKSLILLHIADNGPMETDDIREYLRTLPKKPIKNKTLIYKHLKELEVKHSLLTRSSQGRGKTDSFTLVEGFEGFSRLYTFLQKSHCEVDLLKSKYYDRFVNSEEFLIKVYINLFKLSLIKLMTIFLGDDFKKFVSLVNEKDSKDIVEVLDEFKINAEQFSGFSGFLYLMNTHNVDDLYTISHESFNRLEASVKDGNPVLEQDKFYLWLITQNVFEDSEKAPVLNILRVSQSAIEFVINTSNTSPIFVSKAINRHFRKIINKTKTALNQDSTKQEDIIDTRGSDKESPILTILKSMLVYDLINGRLLTTDIPQEIQQYLFLVDGE